MLKDEDIREVCTRLILAKDSERFQAALTELKIALREDITNAEDRSIQIALNRATKQ